MNIAVIGTNFISDKFVDAARLAGGVLVSAVYSRKYDTGRAFADKHGIETVYTDYLSLLADGRVDAVYIASPTLCHAEQSVRAMRAGKHVLCEKMMGASLVDFLWMKRVQRECDTVLLEAMRPAHDPAIEVVRAALLRLGKLRRADLTFCQYSSRYDAFKAGTVANAFDPALKNSALADIGIYPLHWAVNLFGAPRSVQGKSVFLHNGFEGQGIATLDYGEMLATVSYSKIHGSTAPSVIEGELGTLTVDKMNGPSEITLHLRGCEPERLCYTPVKNNMVYEIAAFRDMVEGKRDFMPYLELTEIAQRVVEELYTSSGIAERMD